jgi:hypothetical protein
MIIGRVAKQEGPFWSAEAELLGAFTHGESRKEAFEVLAELIESMVDRPGFKVTIGAYPAGGEGAVLVSSTEPGLLAAQVLKYQREVHQLTLAEVAKRLGAASLTSYAAYEQGKREPSLGKMSELLAVVAPELALTIGPRTTAAAVRPSRGAKKNAG